MKKIEFTYRKNGFLFKQVSRIGDVAIYSQSDDENSQILYYEVFIIQKNKERVIAGKLIGASESCPSNEQWGTEGYTEPDLGSAMSKAIVLQERIDNRNLAKGGSSNAISDEDYEPEPYNGPDYLEEIQFKQSEAKKLK